MTIDSREFRDALGCFATGVTVITANPEGQQPFGMTVNSFASVSLDPPLVLWSLQNNSEMFDVWERASTFGVNILRADQQDLSNLYARKGDHLLEADHFVAGVTGVPVLPDSLVSMECEVEARYPGGDHTIIVGRVTAMENRDNGEPLLFCAGGYRELART
ncbi:flavin reductase [Halieaceae bacterium IMCC14734]|uniref:Flavin reductase n=1 Tax=Candidatus Litorirhabdus singularis TaxID=2518993 RepID=A0ABT3TFY8_9GAMM|nr:flavin reductase family protein [Candidatus Litorirhabdus singularis]MCX2981201.1 flavin reductase [Candidatus Litorirhabdus singularis]